MRRTSQRRQRTAARRRLHRGRPRPRAQSSLQPATPVTATKVDARSVRWDPRLCRTRAEDARRATGAAAGLDPGNSASARTRSAAVELAGFLDSPAIAARIRDLDATRWTGHPRLPPIRTIVGITLANRGWGGSSQGTRRCKPTLAARTETRHGREPRDRRVRTFPPTPMGSGTCRRVAVNGLRGTIWTSPGADQSPRNPGRLRRPRRYRGER
jgi:hypothetical protein